MNLARLLAWLIPSAFRRREEPPTEPTIPEMKIARRIRLDEIYWEI